MAALLALTVLLMSAMGCAASLPASLTPPPHETTPTREAPSPLPPANKAAPLAPPEVVVLPDALAFELPLPPPDEASDVPALAVEAEVEAAMEAEAEPVRTEVYWGATGRRYHIDPACQAFNGKPPAHSGTLEQAKQLRESWCRFCSADWTDERFLAQASSQP